MQNHPVVVFLGVVFASDAVEEVEDPEMCEGNGIFYTQNAHLRKEKSPDTA